MVSGSSGRTIGGPLRGTRPANRRQLIVAAAADLFYANGYAKVGMGDVADAVAIGPSALYRHFRGKQDLLATVVEDAVRTVDEILTAATADDIAPALAAAMLEHRTAGVLIRRESRHLPEDGRAALREGLRRIGARLAQLVRERRPGLGAAECDLLGWCALAAASSVSYHRLSLPEPAMTALLDELIATILDAPISLPDRPAAAAARPDSLPMQSRREAILAEATKLFATNGFANVSMEDIGAAIGIAGPSVYNHFTVKSEVLATAMFRGDEWLRMDMKRAFAQTADPREGLDLLVRGYHAFVFDNPDLIEVLVSESMHLPEPDRHRARSAQLEYIAEWVHLADRVHPDWEPIGTRIRVQAVQTMMNDTALIPHLRRQPGIGEALHVIGTEVLAIFN